MSISYFQRAKAASGVIRLRAALFLAVLSLLTAPAVAHPVPFSYLDIRLDPGRLDGSLVIHIIDLAHDLNVTPAETLLDLQFAESKRESIIRLLRSRLEFQADGAKLDYVITRIEPLPDRQALALHLRFDSKLNPGSLKINCALFPYDPLHQTFLNIYEEEALVHQEIFDREHTNLDHFTGNRQGALAVIKKFIPGGIYHIFAGPDHILFLVGLLLLGGSLLRLLTIVTAFTIAHSITLTLAALDILDPPTRLIEPVIALSIVYIGIDNLMVGKTGRDVRAWVAFFFGFVHGFGFAGVLREFGLPPQALGWSLFSFNLGVEIGQVCIVLIVATVLTAIHSRNRKLGERITTVGSICVILAGSYWFIERVFF